MRNTFFLSFILITCMMFFSCSSDDESENYSLKVSPSGDLIAESSGEIFELDIETMASNWQYECEDDWILITKNQASDKMSISVKENFIEADREAIIRLAIPGITKEIKVIQKASNLTNFMLPFYEFQISPKMDIVRAFEEARNHEFAYSGQYGYTFKSESKLFKRFIYSFNLMGVLVESKVAVPKSDSLIDDTRFIDFILSKGFELQYSERIVEGGDVYWSEKNQASLVVSSNPVVPFITAGLSREKPVNPEIDENYETFDTYPYPPCLTYGATISDITAKEGRGPDLDMTGADNKQIVYLDSDGPKRYYHLDKNLKLIQCQYTTADINRIGYISWTSLSLYLTKNFKELLKNEGFEFFKYDAINKTHGYRNTSTGLELQIGIMYDNENWEYRANIYYILPTK